MPLNLPRLCTGNPTLLKQLDIQEALEIHPLLNAQAFRFGTAKKTRPIRARPINTILDKSCPTVYESLLLDTLEATQPIKPGSMICWGEAGDVWQQSSKKLHDKYQPMEMDEDGFVVFVPKDGPDSVMNSFQVVADQHQVGEYGGWSIINPWWGDTRFIDPTEAKALLAQFGVDFEGSGVCVVEEGDDDAKKDASRIGKAKVCLHYGLSRVGDETQQDWVLQNRKDAIDTYRVKESFFDSTYEVETKQS